MRAIIPGSALALMIWKDGDKPSLFGARMPYLGEVVAFPTITPPEPCVKPNQRTSLAASRFGTQDVSILAAAVSTARSGGDPDFEVWDGCAPACETAEMCADAERTVLIH